MVVSIEDLGQAIKRLQNRHHRTLDARLSYLDGHQALADRETKACTAKSSSEFVGMHLRKSLEYFSLFVFGNSNTGVFYFKAEVCFRR